MKPQTSFKWFEENIFGRSSNIASYHSCTSDCLLWIYVQLCNVLVYKSNHFLVKKVCKWKCIHLTVKFYINLQSWHLFEIRFWFQINDRPRLLSRWPWALWAQIFMKNKLMKIVCQSSLLTYSSLLLSNCQHVPWSWRRIFFAAQQLSWAMASVASSLKWNDPMESPTSPTAFSTSVSASNRQDINHTTSTYR